MPIVKMDHISIIGLDTDKAKIIEQLMDIGVVEINTQESKLADSDWNSQVVRDGDDSEVMKLDTELSRIASVIDYIEKYDDAKKPMFKTRLIVDSEDFEKVMNNRSDIYIKIDQVDAMVDRLQKQKAEENRLAGIKLSLSPWSSYKLPLELTGTKLTTVLVGILPSIADISKLESEFVAGNHSVVFDAINSDIDQHYISAIFLNDETEEILNVLKKYGFSPIVFKDINGTALENISEIQKQIDKINFESKEIEKQLSAAAKFKNDIKFLYDSLIIERDRLKIQNRILKTKRAFYLDGYVISEHAQKVKLAAEKYDCFVEIRKLEQDEDFPISLKNNSVVKPFEAITYLYSPPSAKSIDPTPFFAPFYFCFYGMMVSDAGYGIVLALSCFLILRKFKLEGMIKMIVSMLMWCGLSTVFWGAMFGGWFGDLVQVSAKVIFNMDIIINPVWFDPIKDPMRLLILSFIIGGIHLLLAMGLKAYTLIRDGKAIDAVCDIGMWYLTLIGTTLFLFGGTFGDEFINVGKYMALAGIAGLILTQGRSEKNIFMKGFKGVASLYSITGYLSDVLSYSRLLALGLGTGVIATVVNTMGSLAGGGFFGIIIMTIVFVIGHSFNIAINALGAFVHSCRLQYVEFFGKFYEGGGKPFEPFKRKTKFINIKVKEELSI